MKNCFRKCCCAIFCCTCCRQTPLNVINNETILLPPNENTKDEFETSQLFIYGSVPPELQRVLLEGENGPNSVVKIVCGKYHCVILLTNNKLLGFGLNDTGQLGLPLTTKEVTQITELNINIPNIDLGQYQILDIAAGDEFSLILIRTADNQTKIINFGTNLMNKYVSIPNTPSQSLENIPNDIANNINKIIAFEKRKIFCTNQNEIYIGGRDFYGTEIDEYVLLKKFGKNIKNIFLQKEGCIVQDEDNEIFALSDNSYRELGLSHGFTNEFEPLRLRFTKSKIKKIAAGARHLLILLEDGELFCLGDNSEGQCCGATSTCEFPNKVETKTKAKIVDCYAGYNHNLIILENGSVYTWGNTDFGKLGYYEDKNSQDTPKEILWMQIRCINYVCLGNQISVIAVGKKEDSIVENYIKTKPQEEPVIIAEQNEMK